MSKQLAQLKAGLISGLAVIVAAQIFTAMITPFFPIITVALVLVLIGGYVFYRRKL